MKGSNLLRFARFVLLAVGFMTPLSYGQVPQGEVLGIITDPRNCDAASWELV
jgi:hypothetical protein